jgi:hypothetical protein
MNTVMLDELIKNIAARRIQRAWIKCISNNREPYYDYDPYNESDVADDARYCYYKNYVSYYG